MPTRNRFDADMQNRLAYWMRTGHYPQPRHTDDARTALMRALDPRKGLALDQHAVDDALRRVIEENAQHDVEAGRPKEDR